VSCADDMPLPGRVLVPDQVALTILGRDYNIIAAISVDVSHQAHVILRAQRTEVDDLVPEHKRFLLDTHEDFSYLYIQHDLLDA
jgi:hypothetical protein